MSELSKENTDEEERQSSREDAPLTLIELESTPSNFLSHSDPGVLAGLNAVDLSRAEAEVKGICPPARRPGGRVTRGAHRGRRRETSACEALNGQGPVWKCGALGTKTVVGRRQITGRSN